LLSQAFALYGDDARVFALSCAVPEIEGTAKTIEKLPPKVSPPTVPSPDALVTLLALRLPWLASSL
jgi:hypothetical protein